MGLKDRILVKKNEKPEPTKQIPFKMPGEIFREKAKEKFTQRLLEEQQKAKEAAVFKAQNVPGFYPPTYYKLHEQELTAPDDGCEKPKSHIEQRIKQRNLFEEYKRQKDEQLTIQRRLQEDHNKKMEQEEIARIRKQMEFHPDEYHIAQEPQIPHVAPKPVTTAITPNIMKRLVNVFGKKKPVEQTNDQQ